MSTVPGSSDEKPSSEKPSSEKPIKIEQEPDFSEKQLYQIYDVTPIADGDALALEGNKFVVVCNICKLRASSKVDPGLQDCVSFQKHALMHKERERSLQRELELERELELGLVDTLEDNKDDHSTNTLFSDTPKSIQPGGDGGLREGYVMVCWFCASENCGSSVNHPVRMRCYVCHEHGKHWSRNCPTGRYRGPPMPERYACSYWDKG